MKFLGTFIFHYLSPTSRVAGIQSLLLLHLVLFSLCLSSCKDDTVVEPATLQGQTYFPIVRGNWISYTADSIVHLDSDDPYLIDTAIRAYHFQLKEEVDSSYYDGEGNLINRLVRYKRADSIASWDLMNVWTEQASNLTAQRVEDNIRFIKLAFPFDARKIWNGNAFNSYPEEDYRYEDIHMPSTIGSQSFDSTVTVIQNDFISNINEVLKKEIYANHIGMIYKQHDSLNLRHLPNGSVVILNGLEYHLTVNGYKN
jgi:hypothetical protein